MKENEVKWTTRKIKECERIKEEDKRDKLAIVKEKTRRYGLSKLNKEETQNLRMRTEERLELTQAKTNYWRWYREKGKRVLQGGKEPGREDTMWINLREEISALEGEEEWKKGEFEILDKKDRKGRREEENKETILKEERGKEEGGKEKVNEGQ